MGYRKRSSGGSKLFLKSARMSMWTWNSAGYGEKCVRFCSYVLAVFVSFGIGPKIFLTAKLGRQAALNCCRFDFGNTSN